MLMNKLKFSVYLLDKLLLRLGYITLR